jgi:hypothetical protein
MEQTKSKFFRRAEWKLILQDASAGALGISIALAGAFCYDQIKHERAVFQYGIAYTSGVFLAMVAALFIFCFCTKSVSKWFMKHFIAVCCGTTPEKIDISAEHWR